MATQSEDDMHIQHILQAAAAHNNLDLQKYLDTYNFADCSAVDVTDPKTGQCALHAAIAGCILTGNAIQNGQNTAQSEAAASETIKLLLEYGAIWNQLDKEDNTPGCLAWKNGLEDLYQLMVDAGVRAEMLLNRLDGYEQLNGDDDIDGDENNGEEGIDEEIAPDLVDSAAPDTTPESSAVITAADAAKLDVNSSGYLSSVLSFDKDKLLDDQNNGVMMEWERGIMKQSAMAIVDKPGLKVLNIGAGMLIFDSIVQAMDSKPIEHHIVEAHPDVLANMQASGWSEKEGVTIHAGKWQDVLPDLVMEGHTFDAIYFDTFAESYHQFKDFFSEQVIGLLSQEGKWSFFNGMGADRQISYDVYQKVVEVDLFESGFDVEWQDISIPVLDKEWEGVKRKYWNIDKYRLPICRFMD